MTDKHTPGSIAGTVVLALVLFTLAFFAFFGVPTAVAYVTGQGEPTIGQGEPTLAATEQLDQGDVKALIQVVSSINTRFENLAVITKQLAQENQMLRAYLDKAEQKEERNTTQNDRPEQQSGEGGDQHAMGADHSLGSVVRYASGPVRQPRRSTQGLRGNGYPAKSSHCSGPGCSRNDGTRSVYTGLIDKVGIATAGIFPPQ